jgi:HK97 family phage major capsid protein
MENFLDNPTSDVGKAIKKAFDESQDKYETLKNESATKAELQAQVEKMKELGRALEGIKAGEKEKTIKAYGDQFADFIMQEEVQKQLQEIIRTKSGMVKFEPESFVNSDDASNIDIRKAVGPVTTGQGTIVGTVPPNNDTNLQNINYRNDNPLVALCSTVNTSSHSYSYTEAEPKEGAFTEVLEGASKPQIDFQWKNRYVTPFKIAAYETLTDEVLKDVARMKSVAQNFLRNRHDLFKANQIYFGAGNGTTAIKGATVYGRTFVAGSMALALPAGSANFMDVVNAIITDIYTTHNYTDESSYMPNIVLVNPVDFFLNLVAAKDGNGLPLYPQAGLFNTVTIGGVTIKPWEKIPAGKIFVADMSKYNLTNWVPYSVQIGWVNDDFIKNQLTMVGESRFHAFVKNHDAQAFVYDDIATVKTAIEAV